MADVENRSSNRMLEDIRFKAAQVDPRVHVGVQASAVLTLVDAAALVIAMPCICHLCNGKCRRCMIAEGLK